MKYRKIIAIFVINIMVISAIAATASARFLIKADDADEIADEGTMKLLKISSVFTKKEIYVIDVNNPSEINSRLKGYHPINLDDFDEKFKTDGLKVSFKGKLNFPSIISIKRIPLLIRGYLPIKLSLIKEIVDQPELVFDISLDSSFLMNESIPVKATITNSGKIPVKVSKLSLKMQSLDFYILTPDNKKLHYIGELHRCYPEHILLKPGQKHSQVFDITDEENPFGESEDNPYDFSTAGTYEIVGRYTSHSNSCTEKNEGLEIFLESKTYRFEITDEVQKTVTLTLATDPREVPNDVLTFTEPVRILPILDGKIHAVYYKGEEVEIVADESYQDYIFNRYSVDATSEKTELTIMMDSDKLIIAEYKKDEPGPTPPEACFTFEPKEIIEGNEVVFDSSCSSDLDGEILKYHWEFGDLTSSEEKNPTHIFENSGRYKVTLLVIDEDGLKGSHSQIVKVVENELTDTGIIYGTIRESSIVEVKEKTPIPDAKVEVISTGRTKEERYSTTSNEKGEYELEVKLGEYKVIASKKEYKPQIKTVLVEADTSNKVNFDLEKRDADLEFDISVQTAIFSEDSPLSISASITNNERTTVTIDEIGIDYGTLELQIKTPDGKFLKSKQQMILLPPKVTIGAGETHTVIVDGLTVGDFIVISYNGEESTKAYDFVPGEYIIKGIYTSRYPSFIKLVSPEEVFRI